MRRMLTKSSVKWVVAVFCAVALIGGTLVWHLGGGGGAGAPGGVIAEVDGEPIYLEDLQMQVDQQVMMMQMGGQEVDDEFYGALQGMVLDNMISIELLTQEARRQGVDVPSDEVDEEMDMIVEQYFEGEEEALQEALSAEGIDIEDLRDDIENQLRVDNFIDAYLAQEYEGEADEVTEEELRELYEQYDAEMEGLPGFEEMEPELRAEILEGREQQAIDRLVRELRENSDIEIYQ